eukprot:m.33251 g.33251  ORF g.33251 m.33251 type:complete len:636 (+) comp9457_c1_seq2:192-2099(+)
MAEQQDHLDFPRVLEPVGELPGFEMEMDQRSHNFGYEPSPPQYLNIDEARETLSKKISARPSREELMKLNILKEYHSAPQLHATQRALQRARVEDTLQRRIPNRPSREALQAQNILKSTRVGPVIQSSREALARASLTERLNETIAQRPGIMDLVLDQIFQTEQSVFELVASEAVEANSEVPTPMPDATSLPSFDLMETASLMLPPQGIPPAPPIPPSPWNAAALTLPPVTLPPASHASFYGLEDGRPLPMAFDAIAASVGVQGVDVRMASPASHRPASVHARSSVPASPAPVGPIVVSSPAPQSAPDPLVRRPSESKIKKFRYHEYKYPAEKPKRPSSQTRRRTPKAPAAAKNPMRVAADDQVLLPAGVGYETAVQQQARFLHLMQQAQESPSLPNFGPDGFTMGMSPGSAQSPLHDLLLDAVSPNTPAPQTPDHHFRPGSAAHGNPMAPTVTVPRAANPAPGALQLPRTHGHNRASSWGGGMAGKTTSLPLGFTFQAAPASPAMPAAPRATPPIMRAQSLLVVQPLGSPLAGPGERPPASHAGPTMSLPGGALGVHALSMPPIAPIAPISAGSMFSVPPLSISTTLASHPPPHELGDTSFGLSFQFDDTFTNTDTLPDFDFSAPLILPGMHPA